MNSDTKDAPRENHPFPATALRRDFPYGGEPSSSSPPNALWQVVLRQQQLQLISQLAALNPLLFNNGTPYHQDYLDKLSETSSLRGEEDPSPKRREPKKASATATGSGARKSHHAPGEGREKLFTCKICERSFGYKHVLQNHERTHTGEKPFECKVCSKRFTRDHHLKTHMRLHTGEKPYSCSHCDRQFVQVANLRRHLRVHTGEKPYKCEVCSSCFSDSNQLKAHILSHANPPSSEGLLYECGKCNAKYRRRTHLNHHSCSAPKSEEEFRELTTEDEDEEGSSPEPLKDLKKIHNRQRKAKDPKRMMLLPSEPPIQTEPEDLSAKKSEFASNLKNFNCQIAAADLPQL